jgi:alkylation response protein AidB-like acyl-CoA dehydrogenase
MKKWITNGIFCDFFTTAVRTGGKDVPGMRGISLLLLEKGMPGLSLRKMKCMGVVTSGTTFIAMDNVKVPVSNLIGREGEGFSYIMVNFNHERLLMCNQAVALARCAFEEAMLHAHKRKTFGKALIEHPVIRLKLAHMARQIEAANALLYQCLYNYARVESKQIISGAIALLKAHSSQTLEYCAREALQIFGGQGYTKSGPGAKVERIYREVKFLAVPGGSEEILLDLGARQASKFMPKI